LGKPYKRSGNFIYNRGRLSDSFHFGTKTDKGPKKPKSRQGTEKTGTKGDFRDVEERSNKCLQRSKRSIHKYHLSGREEGWGKSASDKLETVKYKHPLPAFQNGGTTLSQIHVTAGGLHVQAGYEGCLFFGPISQEVPRESTFPMGGRIIRIPLPLFWSGSCPKDFHQASEGSSVTIKEIEYSDNNLSRRHAITGKDKTGGFDSKGYSDLPVTASRICYKSKEVGPKLTKLLGLLCSTAQAVLPAHLQFRYLQKLQIRSLHQNSCYQQRITLDKNSKQELLWWLRNLELCNGKSLIQMPPQLIIQTDASKTGWGASCQGQATGGAWSKEERQLHINVLELKAVNLALLSFVKKGDIKSIHFQNTTAIRYLQKMGGTKSLELLNISKEIWKFLLFWGITITTEYLPSKLNVVADFESRRRMGSSEWKLCPDVFSRVCQLMGEPQIDLFASRLNHQLPQYIAWRPDPYSQGTDAMQQTWTKRFPYAFPPFCLISRVLQKVLQEKVEKILIVTPTWHTQPWYPQLLQMSIARPLLLPNRSNLLKDPLGNLHTLIQNRTLRLAVWKVSGIESLWGVFRQQLPILSQMLGDNHRQITMSRPRESGLAGAIEDKLVPFVVM